jgi:hypothetical protein
MKKKPAKKTATKPAAPPAPPTIEFSIDAIQHLPCEALAALIFARIESLERAWPETVKKKDEHGYERETTPEREFASWLRGLPNQHFKGLIDATKWPPRDEPLNDYAKKQLERKTAAKTRAKPAKKRAPKVTKPKPWEARGVSNPGGPRSKATLDAIKANDKQPPLPFDNTPRPIADDTQPGPAEADPRTAILNFMREPPLGNVTAKEIGTHCRLSDGQTKGLLKRLREQGAIKVEGKNRGARYSLATTSTLNGASASL